jgi:hypothetical protein
MEFAPELLVEARGFAGNGFDVCQSDRSQIVFICP